MPVYTASSYLTYIALVLCILSISACTEPDPIARVSHDFVGNHELYSYETKPADVQGQGEALAKKIYGIDTKSSSTMFMCLWRNTLFRKLDDGRPAEIFLACIFGPSAVEAPKSIIELGELYQSLDTAHLKAGWEYNNGTYQLSRFEVEISNDKKSFRSQNLAQDMSQVQVLQENMKFPKADGETFIFNLQSSLPQRLNSGSEQVDPIVSVVFSGAAEPMPNWKLF